MGETTVQPASQAAETTVQPASQAAGKKGRHLSILITVATALTAVVAAVISAWSVNTAKQADTATKQQQLLNLTFTIAQQFDVSQTQGITDQLEAEGEAGAVLINDLNGNGVASIEYIQVARALNNDGHGIAAATFFKKAVNAPPYDPETRATALRYLAVFYYHINQPMAGRRYAMQAVKALNRSSKEPRFFRANAIAQAYYLDADAQLDTKGGCPIAARDMAAGQKALGTYSADGNVQTNASAAKDQYKSKCKGHA
jgi:hypothetical protein